MDYALILATLIVLVASFVRSVAGFGFALVASPFLLLVLEPKSVVVINNILAADLSACERLQCPRCLLNIAPINRTVINLGYTPP